MPVRRFGRPAKKTASRDEDMSEIEEFQRRINAALDRIAQGIEAAPSGGGDPAEMDALRQALEDEKLANEQLQERVKALRARRNKLEEDLEAMRDQTSESLSKLDSELQALRRANQQLRDNNQALREANAAGVGEPHLINKSMMAELESLRASRAVDRAETTAILSELTAAMDNAAETHTQEEEA
jgi:DNA repair exonuclease SbcCD ATPase subunit